MIVDLQGSGAGMSEAGMSEAGVSEERNAHWISGFWRRIGAFAIDSVILGVVGFGLALFFERQFVQLGGWGRLVGFLVALFYFGMLNSRLAGGQTIGKRILGIRVVDGNNTPVDLPRSFVRYSIIGVPFFLSGARFTHEVATSFWMYPISIVTVGGGLSVAYLYVFNRVTRQSLHDLAVGSYVVDAQARKEQPGTLWRPHLIAVALLSIVGVLPPAFASILLNDAPLEDLFAARAVLMEHPSASCVDVYSGTATRSSSSGETTSTNSLSARVMLESNTISDAALAESLATMLVRSHSSASEVDVIEIVLAYGYDIGIVSWWTEQAHAYGPTDLIDENRAVSDRPKTDPG